MEVLPRRGGFGVIAGDVKKTRHISAVVQFLYSLVTAKKRMGCDPPSGAALGSSPKCRAAAVQSEELVKPTVADIRASGAVFLRVLGERIEQAPPRRFGELLHNTSFLG